MITRVFGALSMVGCGRVHIKEIPTSERVWWLLDCMACKGKEEIGEDHCSEQSYEEERAYAVLIGTNRAVV